MSLFPLPSDTAATIRIVHDRVATPAQIKDHVSQMGKTNPAGAASLASRHIAVFTPAEAVALLHDLMSTRDPNRDVAEILASRVAADPPKKKRLVSLINRAKDKGLDKVIEVLQAKTN